jgi:hypothetical protein
MSDYQVTQIGAPDRWRDHFGGFDESRSRDIRAGGEQLPHLPNDSSRAFGRPMPWRAS